MLINLEEAYRLPATHKAHAAKRAGSLDIALVQKIAAASWQRVSVMSFARGDGLRIIWGMESMHGQGDILRIDLSTEEITREPILEELRRKYIGGEGINTRLFWEHFLRVSLYQSFGG